MAALFGTDLDFLPELTFTGTRRIALSDECVLECEQCPSAGDTSTMIWPSAIRLATFCVRNAEALVQWSKTSKSDMRVLELGCGFNPIVSIALAHVGIAALATDLPSVVDDEHFTQCIAPYSLIQRRALDWTQPFPDDLGPFDLILAADVLYNRDLHKSFVTTLQKALQCSPSSTSALICWQLRNQQVEKEFLTLLKEHGMLYILLPRTTADVTIEHGITENHYKYTRIIRVLLEQ